MTKDNSSNDIEMLLDGECTPQEETQIRADIAADPAMAAAFARLDKLNRVVRRAGHEVEAPDRLRRAVENRFSSEDFIDTPAAASPGGSRRRLSRRALLVSSGGLLAAGLAGVAVLPRLGGNLDPVDTFFRDFETYLLKDRALDVTETDMVRLAGWFGDRLPFSLPPISSNEGDVRLVGGRLCWLLERRLASLSYETAHGPMVLYIMNAEGIDAPSGRDKPDIGKALSWHRSSGNASLIWSSEELLFVMVGSQDTHKLMSIARALTG